MCKYRSFVKQTTLLTLLLLTSGCVSTIVGTAVDVTIEAAKVPFKVAGAVIDVATPDKKKSDKD